MVVGRRLNSVLFSRNFYYARDNRVRGCYQQNNTINDRPPILYGAGGLSPSGGTAYTTDFGKPLEH